jgi:hypothetical protein
VKEFSGPVGRVSRHTGGEEEEEEGVVVVVVVVEEEEEEGEEVDASHPRPLS